MADRYWVGGAGTWNSSDTTHWSASSGGAGGASVPTSADNVFFNSASNATAYAVTLGSNFVGTASFSIISALTSTVTVATVTSGALAVGNLIVISLTLFRITSLGTGTGGVGTYNCSVLRGINGTGQGTTSAYSPAPICADISFSGPAVGTLTWVTTSSAIEVAGGVTVAASGVTMSPILIYTGSSTHTITTNSVSMSSSYLAGTGTYTLGSAYTTSGNLYFCLGTFTTANFALTVNVFDQDSATTRTINLGSSTVTIGGISYPTGSGNPSSVFGTNVTFNAGTSQVNFTGTNCFFFSFGLNKTWYNVSLTSTGINQQTSGGIKLGYGTADTPTFNNFSIAGQAVNTGVAQIILQTNMTINGTFTIGAATSVLKRIMLRTPTVGTARTITAAAFAAGATDVDWQDITMAGAAGTISGTRFGDCGGCTNITFDAAKTVYWNLAGAQNWSATAWATSSGASPALNNFPLAQDTAVFDNTGSVTGTITIDGGSTNQGWNIGTVDMSARTSAMTLAAGSTNSYPWIYGNWVNGSGTTVTNTGTIIFANRSIKTINSAGKAFPGAMTINAPGGGLQLLTNNLTTGTSGSAVVLTLTLGTMDFNNLSWTHYGDFTSNASGTRGLTFGTTGVFNFISGGSGDFNISSFTGLTVSGTSSVSINPNGDNFCNVWLSSATEAQSLNVNYTGTGTITHSAGTVTYKNLTFTGFTGTYSPTNIGFNIYGNLTLAAAMTLSSSTGTWNFVGTSGTKSITTAAKTMDFPITFNGIGSTWQLIDALTMGSTRTLTLTNGTLNLNGQTLTVGTAFSTSNGTKNLTFNGGTLVCPTSGVTAFNNVVPTGFTTTAGTGTGYIQMTGATAKTFVGGGSTYNCVLQQAGAGDLTITGSNSFLDLQATVAGQPSSVLFTAATTTTFTSFTLSGTAGNLVTIGSVTAASHTLSKASGTVSAGYLSISRSTATGGATWYAGTSSTNGGNNTGWLFTNPPGGVSVTIGTGITIGGGITFS